MTTNKIEGIERLNILLEEEKITEAEFAQLRRDLLENKTDGSAPLTPETQGESEQPKAPTIYKWAFGLGIASIFFAGLVGLLGWATVVVSAIALYSERSSKGRWMAWTGLGLGLLFSLVNAAANGHIGT